MGVHLFLLLLPYWFKGFYCNSGRQISDYLWGEDLSVFDEGAWDDSIRVCGIPVSGGDRLSILVLSVTGGLAKALLDVMSQKGDTRKIKAYPIVA